MKFAEWLKINETMALKGDYKGSIFQRLVAAKYKLAPTQDQAATPAFQDLARKIDRQSQFLSSKYEMKPTQDDPYHSMKAMTQDIQKQKAMGVRKPVIPVYAEPPKMDGEQQSGHPVFSNQDNVKQRGVHDIIAHYFGQHPFSARGEYGAYNRHLKTLCNTEQAKSGNCLAAKAMFTEVVAQTSYYYIYGTFADQKAVILDDFDHARVGLLSPSSPLNAFFFVQDKVMSLRPDFSWDKFAVNFGDLAMELVRQEQQNKKLSPIFSTMARGY
jgi:hypothetical protein